MATSHLSPGEARAPSPSQLPPVPSSPTYSFASTANPISQYNLPPPPPPRPAHAVLTKADLDQSQRAYADLTGSAKAYRVALAALSTAASSFGAALESCARLKEARAEALGPPAAASLSHSFTNKGSCTADALLAAAGVQHLVANHGHILSETAYRAFEVPLLHELDKWRRGVDDEAEAYAAAAREQSRAIRRLEREGQRLHRQRRRDVGQLRGHLVDLTAKLDGLTTLHADHSRALLRESQDMSARIADAGCSLVRAEVDIFESLARKGWTGGGLDDLLEKGVDLFANDDDDDAGNMADGGKLFSILPPKSILADSASIASAPARGGHRRTDSLLMETDRYLSLAGAVSPMKGKRGDADAESIASEPMVRPRGGGVRPFSPQPVAVDPDEVMGELRHGHHGDGPDEGEPSAGPRRYGFHHDDDGAVFSAADDDTEVATPRPRPSAFKILRQTFDDDGQAWRDEDGEPDPGA